MISRATESSVFQELRSSVTTKVACLLFLALALVFPGATAAFASSIAITSPTNGASVSGPVTVIASDTGYSDVTATQIYADGTLAYTTSGTTVNTSLALAAGSHQLSAKVWYNSGSSNALSSPVSITVGSGVPPGSYTDYENNAGVVQVWQTCNENGCGDDGGNGPVPIASVTTGITSPSDYQKNATYFSSFDTAAVGGSWADSYWYTTHPTPPSTISYLNYSFDLYIPTNSPLTPGSADDIEFECQQTINGYVYNFAWQINYGSQQLRAFNYVTKSWVASSSVPWTTLSKGAWHHVIAQYHSEGTTVYHDSLTIDGTVHTLSTSDPANALPAANTGGGPQFSNAFQLDADPQTTLGVYVDDMVVVEQHY